MSVKKIILYSTLGCHLCEHAKAMMLPLLSAQGYELEEVEIADSDELLAQYQLTIPVAKNPQTGRELFWPFVPEQVAELLQ